MKFEIELEVMSPIILPSDRELKEFQFKIDGNKIEIYSLKEEFRKNVKEMDAKELFSMFSKFGNIDAALFEIAKKKGATEIEIREYSDKVAGGDRLNLYNGNDISYLVKESIVRSLITASKVGESPESSDS